MIGEWTFFSNHGHVLVCLARNGSARLRDVAMDVGITERAVQKIVKDLQQAGYVAVRKQGRCNRYRINRRKFLRHSLESHCTIGKLLALVATGGRAPAIVAEIIEGDEEEAVLSMPASDPEPEPVTESIAEPKPERQPKPESKPGPASKPEAVLKPEPEAETEKVKGKNGPVDTREQGSLF